MGWLDPPFDKDEDGEKQSAKSHARNRGRRTPSPVRGLDDAEDEDGHPDR